MRINNDLPKNLPNVSLDYHLNVDSTKFRELSMNLLNGEEIVQESAVVINPSMEVWSHYIDTELRTFNINQAKKVRIIRLLICD